MFEGNDQAIFELLAATRQVEISALEAALAEHRATGRALARLLVESGSLAPRDLLRAIAAHLGCAWKHPLPDFLPAAGLIEARFAKAHGVVPLSGGAATVEIAALNPFALSLVDDLAFALGRRVTLTVADPAAVQALLRRHYGEDDPTADSIQGMQVETGRGGVGGAMTPVDLEKLAGQAPIVRFVNLVLEQAVRDGASDIHFEPFEERFQIRCRVNGTLVELPPPPVSLALPVISRLKVLSSLNIAERRLPQDGRLRLSVAGRAVDLRVATLPTQFGESVVLRVLDQTALRPDIGQLGLPDAMRRTVQELIHRPHGIFVVTGPTGSGKTTTLYSCLQELNAPDVKLLTIEDPVEYEIEGAMQVSVNAAAGLDFARALRTFLRQDPDIVMVGEIRDTETARTAIQASLTGHLVLATLHTNDASSAVTRLVDMGIEPFLLASAIEGVLAQRLLRRICSACRIAHEETASVLRQLDVPATATDRVMFYRGAGCAACQQSGYRGRIGIFELLRMSEPLRDLVVRGAALAGIRQRAVADGMVPLRSAAVAAALAGETTVEEVLKYT